MTRALLLAYCPLCGDRYKKERIGEDNHICKESNPELVEPSRPVEE